MTGHEVHALFSLALFVPVEFVAAEIPVSKVPQRTIVATEEVADIVAKPAIPFLPAIPDKTPYLLQSRGISRRGDNFASGKRSIRLDIP